MSNKKTIIIAVDGPSASGKSTVSRGVAKELGFLYVDSGSLYRGMTWKCIREGVDVRNPDAVIELMNRMSLEFFADDMAASFTIDGEEPGQQLRSEPVRESVADIAAIPEVRVFIVNHLRQMVRFGSLSMEGRDIGSVVFPDTPFKFYLDAEPGERARRRHAEQVQMEGKGDVNTVLHSLTKRDEKDTTRKTAPLQIPLGAQVIDSTAMSAQDVVALIVRKVRTSGLL